MALRLSGFTRASSLGPIIDFMQGHGGSASRVLREVDLPLALLHQPELVFPLREQFRFLERAARRTGDPFFGARLGQVVRARNLSAYGAWVCSAQTLSQAIDRAQADLQTMLQTSTILRFTRSNTTASWSIEFVEPETEGRYHNELLGVSYMIDAVRNFTGRGWCPDVVMTTLPVGSPKAELEDIFRANISHGHAVNSIRFDAALLGNQRAMDWGSLTNSFPDAEPDVPIQNDALATIESVIHLALYEGYPRIDWVASKLGLTRRSLQRLLEYHGGSFNQIAAQVIFSRAKTLLVGENNSITEIAADLGYRDPAHFTRAFKRWAGVSPIIFRRQNKRLAAEPVRQNMIR